MAGKTVKLMCTAAVVSAGLLNAPMVSAETLTDALIAAYKNSDLLVQNRAVLRATDETVAQAVAGLRPVLAFIANYSHSNPATSSLGNDISTLELSASLTLYDFGHTRLGIEAAKENVLATSAGLVGVEQQVLLGAVTAYMGMRNAQEVVVLNQGNVAVLQKELSATNDKFSVGEVTKTDVAIAQASLAAAQSQLTAAEGSLQVAREAYKVATGVYPQNLSVPPRAPQLPKSINEAQMIALRTSPAILQGQHQVRAADLNTQYAESSVRPKIATTAQYGTNTNGKVGAAVGLSLTQPIYSGGQLNSLGRQARANADAAKAGLMQTTLTTAQTVANAWSQLNIARASIVADQEQVRASQAAFDGVSEEAKLGSRTTLDVLTAEQTLLNAKASLIAAETSQYIAVYSVLASVGLLTADHLKLGIPTYDPQAYFNAVHNAPALSPQGAKLDRILKGLGNN